MSSHHTQKAINLHHDQVNAARERHRLKQQERMDAYATRRKELRWRYFLVMSLAVSVWAAWMISVATGTYYVLAFLGAG